MVDISRFLWNYVSMSCVNRNTRLLVEQKEEKDWTPPRGISQVLLMADTHP